MFQTTQSAMSNHDSFWLRSWHDSTLFVPRESLWSLSKLVFVLGVQLHLSSNQAVGEMTFSLQPPSSPTNHTMEAVRWVHQVWNRSLALALALARMASLVPPRCLMVTQPDDLLLPRLLPLSLVFKDVSCAEGLCIFDLGRAIQGVEPC
jgi:hypothetical protein